MQRSVINSIVHILARKAPKIAEKILVGFGLQKELNYFWPWSNILNTRLNEAISRPLCNGKARACCDVRGVTEDLRSTL